MLNISPVDRTMSYALTVGREGRHVRPCSDLARSCATLCSSLPRKTCHGITSHHRQAQFCGSLMQTSSCTEESRTMNVADRSDTGERIAPNHFRAE